MRIVKWVALGDFPGVARGECLRFPRALAAFVRVVRFRSLIATSLRERGEHVPQPLPAQPYAQISLVICIRERLLRKAARRVEYVRPHHQTAAPDRRHVLHGRKPVQVSHALARMAPVVDAQHAADAEEKARVADAPVARKQLRAHTADVRPLAIHQQFVEKAVRKRFHLVAQKQQIVAARGLPARVVRARRREGLVLPQHAEMGIALLRAAVIVRAPFGFGLLFHDQHLKRRGPGVGVNALYTAREHRRFAAAAHDHADERTVRRILRQSVPHAVRARAAGDALRFAREAEPLKLRVHRALPGAQRIGFRALDALRRRLRMAAPDIQAFRQMDDLAGRNALGQAQDQIVILRAVKLWAFLLARLLQQRPAEHQKMCDVIAAAQRVRAIIRLEMVGGEITEIFVQHDLVRVDNLCAGFDNGRAGLIERVGIEHVVVVEQGNIFPVGQRKARCRVGGDAAVVDFCADDPRVARGSLDDAGDAPVRGVAGVDQNELPVGIALPEDAAQHLAQKFDGRVVHGHDDADARRARHGDFPLAAQRPPRRQIRPEPPVVLVRDKAPAKLNLAPDPLDPFRAEDGKKAAQHGHHSLQKWKMASLIEYMVQNNIPLVFLS